MLTTPQHLKVQEIWTYIRDALVREIFLPEGHHSPRLHVDYINGNVCLFVDRLRLTGVVDNHVSEHELRWIQHPILHRMCNELLKLEDNEVDHEHDGAVVIDLVRRMPLLFKESIYLPDSPECDTADLEYPWVLDGPLAYPPASVQAQP